MERSMPPRDPTDESPLATVREFVPSGQLSRRPDPLPPRRGRARRRPLGLDRRVLANDRRRERRVPRQSRRDLGRQRDGPSVRSAQSRGWTIDGSTPTGRRTSASPGAR